MQMEVQALLGEQLLASEQSRSSSYLTLNLKLSTIWYVLLTIVLLYIILNPMIINLSGVSPTISEPVNSLF